MITFKNRRSFRLACTAGLLSFSLLGANAQAGPGEADPLGFNDLRQTIAKMPQMTDKNKDGMISKQEYLDMQAKMFDMASKKGVMTMAEFKAFMAEFKTFGQ